MLYILQMLYICIEQLKIKEMRLTNKEYYTEVKGQIEVVEHLDTNRYIFKDGGKNILIIRVKSETFKNKKDAIKYFK